MKKNTKKSIIFGLFLLMFLVAHTHADTWESSTGSGADFDSSSGSGSAWGSSNGSGSAWGNSTGSGSSWDSSSGSGSGFNSSSGSGSTWNSSNGSGNVGGNVSPWESSTGSGSAWGSSNGSGSAWGNSTGSGSLWESSTGSGNGWESSTGSGSVWDSSTGSGAYSPNRVAYSGNTYYNTGYSTGGYYGGNYGYSGGNYGWGGNYNYGGGTTYNSNPKPTRDLNVACAPNNTRIRRGESVTWIAQPSGANGKYTYSWTGADGLLGQQKTILKSYNTDGVYSATLTVKSGRQEKTVVCANLYVGDPIVNTPVDTSLSVSCSADEDRIDEGERVEWRANASGGNGNYTYDWDGTDSLSGSGSTITKRYYNGGYKDASVRVTDSNGRTSGRVSCNDTVYVGDNYNNYNDNISLSCRATVVQSGANQTVRWVAEMYNNNYSNYGVTYSWTGTDNLYGYGNTVDRTYTNPGLKTARVVAYSNGRSASADCSTYSNAVLGYTSTYIPPTSNGVYLSQVPYTGIADWSWSLITFLASLMLASALGAYKIVKVKALRDSLSGEAKTAEVETLARGAGILFSRDALSHIAASIQKEKQDAKQVIAYIRGKVAANEDGMSIVSLSKAKELVA